MVDGKYYVYFSGISKDEMRGVGLLVGKDIFDLHLRLFEFFHLIKDRAETDVRLLY